jgi:hypothetical protein
MEACRAFHRGEGDLAIAIRDDLVALVGDVVITKDEIEDLMAGLP